VVRLEDAPLLTEGHVWAFVDGSEACILMKQAVLEQKGKGEANPAITPPRLPEDRSPPLPATRREVFALDEGDVVLTFPENLSVASYEDLEAYLQLFLRKAKRRVSAEHWRAKHDGDGPALKAG
jgi:hypothetical protein